MKRTAFYAVIIAGGAGERLWPLSTPERPKQFLKIFGGKTLIRQAVERVTGLVSLDNILIVTSKSLARATREELSELPRKNMIFEPCRKNTGPAIAVALGEIRRRSGENAVVSVLTADQLMTKPHVFRRMLRRAFEVAAKRDVVVTLGVKPKFPATGYGYIDVSRRVFVEKPDAATAKRYVASGKYVWNAGMFIFRTGALQEILAKVAPELAVVSDRICHAKSANAFLPRLYPTLTSISFDYAVMEKTRHIDVVSGDFGWDDVGSYVSLSQRLPRDASGNSTLGPVRQLDCRNCSFVSEGSRISAFGLSDVVVSTCGDEVLVMSSVRAAELKALLAV